MNWIETIAPEVRQKVKEELDATPPGTLWTTLRPFLPGEPSGQRHFMCQGDWPSNGKGKNIPCPGTPTHIHYAVGGTAHGMEVIMCTECVAKFTNPNFDWDGPEKARF